MVPIELSHPALSDANQARIYLENIRWPHGASCPCCGRLDPVKALGGDSMGPGWYHCGDCRKKFTVRVGTVFERSHIALHKWLLGFRMYASSKKGPSARQLHQTLGITYRSGWFMARRIRAAMRDGDPAPRGGKDKVAEADERAIGPAKDVFVNERGWVKERGTATKRKAVTRVERGGRARSIKVDDLSAKTIRKALFENVVLDGRLHTDEAHRCRKAGEESAAHERVTHSAGEYARYSNRGVLGVNDSERTTRAIKGAEGKRLTYRQPRKHPAA